MPPPAVAPPESTTETACPLDCPDACTLSVTLRGGRITKIDGSARNPVTNGWICAKVRRFARRIYGDDRLLHPAVRTGRKGEGIFRQQSWDEVLMLIGDKLRETRERFGGEAILPLCYGGSNGWLTQDHLDAVFFRRLGASRLLRTVCAAPTGAANMGLYGKMASVAYADYPEAKLIVLWGVNPSVSGPHLSPYLKAARDRGALLIVVDPRGTLLARQADLHLAVRPGTDLPVALALHRFLFATGRADQAFLDAHTTGADQLRARADEWTFARAAEVSGVPEADLSRFAELYAAASPALVKCGWGLERNRNGGSAAAAVMALPAVAGKFGLRGGGYSMSNSNSWGIDRTWLTEAESDTRAINMNQIGQVLTTPGSTPVKALFVYNCNPAVTLPDQARVIEGLAREDLFTVVFDQVMTDTAKYADVVLPATTYFEHYDFAKGYGPMTLQLGRPVIDHVGESRPNNDVFADLLRELDLLHGDEPDGELEAMLQVLRQMPAPYNQQLSDAWMAEAPFGGRPVQFADVFPNTPDRKVHLCPAHLDEQAPIGLYGFQPDPGTSDYPLALISPASDRTISSTLGELPRPVVGLEMHPDDAHARGLVDDDDVRVFNASGEVRLKVQIVPTVRPGTVSMPKGLWRRSTANGWTANVFAPATLADLGGGACFNDARVQVEGAQARTPSTRRVF